MAQKLEKVSDEKVLTIANKVDTEWWAEHARFCRWECPTDHYLTGEHTVIYKKVKDLKTKQVYAKPWDRNLKNELVLFKVNTGGEKSLYPTFGAKCVCIWNLHNVYKKELGHWLINNRPWVLTTAIVDLSEPVYVKSTHTRLELGMFFYEPFEKIVELWQLPASKPKIPDFLRD